MTASHLDSSDILLSLDVGSKWVGLATASESTPPIPLSTIPKKGAEQAILAICTERNITRVIVGLPLSDNGEENEKTEIIRNFARRLIKRGSPPVIFANEYGSSEEAKQRLAETTLNQKQQKERGAIDALAATIILERYLATND